MVTELKGLLHDVAETPASEAVDTDLLLAQAKRRVTRRRRSGIAGVCVAVASVALVAGVLARAETAHRPEPPTDSSPGPRVVSDLSGAPMAVQGVDLRVVATYDVRSLAGGTGRLIEAVTPDGLLIYRDGPDGGAQAREIGLLDPATGEATALPDAIARIGANRIIADGDLIAGASYGVPSAALWYFDTATQQWDRLDLADILAAADLGDVDAQSASVSRIQLGTDQDDRPFLAIGIEDAGSDRARLLTVTVDGSLDVVDLGEVSVWAMSAGTLAYVPADKPDSDEVTLMDLGARSQQTVQVPGRGDCSITQLWMRPDRLIALQACSAGGASSSQLQVLGLDGRSIHVLRDRSLEVVSTANQRMLLRSPSTSGLFLYDIDTGEVLRLTPGSSGFEDIGTGDRMRWVYGSPIQQGAGLRLWVADFPAAE